MTKQNSRQKLLDKLSIDLDKAFNERVGLIIGGEALLICYGF